LIPKYFFEYLIQFYLFLWRGRIQFLLDGTEVVVKGGFQDQEPLATNNINE
jgi:hypothetical protein